MLVIAMKIAKGKGTARTEKKEVLLPVEDRKIGKRKAALKANESSKKRVKKEKITKKDPNKPKRPPSAFFVFLEEFRKVYKQEHPNVKAVSAVGKAGGEKWKSLSAAEKAPYEAKAAKRKTDYEKLMTAYNKKQCVEHAHLHLNPDTDIRCYTRFNPLSKFIVTLDASEAKRLDLCSKSVRRMRMTMATTMMTMTDQVGMWADWACDWSRPIFLDFVSDTFRLCHVCGGGFLKQAEFSLPLVLPSSHVSLRTDVVAVRVLFAEVFLKWPTMPGKVVHPFSPVVTSTIDPDRAGHLYN
ncbi:hypothetical protein NC653_025921 [Populus alba x Populus x berolinensis]|uniref:HMG box domain-containing protein n=1 Tax=Populus alba x Populus x berolinensis TaxID=444605 RepID=A0AAD6MD93_9ROSI|nr:hypothetical protein NC653_025921 [Populus alba x Populus x berolinensis]